MDKKLATEFAKFLTDDIYAMESLLRIFSKKHGGYVDFKLFEKQKEIVRDFATYRYNLVAKPRQAGISTTTQGYCAVKAALASKDNPETIVCIANKLALAKKFSKAIKDFIEQMPRWLFGEKYTWIDPKTKKYVNDIWSVNSKVEYELAHNGSKIISVATSGDALRGYVPTYLVFDEAAFIDDVEVFTASMAAISTGGKATLISTPNGQDAVYYETYINSMQQNPSGDNNGFNVIEMRWYQDPRYNEDLTWYDESGNFVKEEEDFTFESFENSIKAGYKPTSTWYRDMCKSFNNNKRKIAQELDVSFLGSGGNVIDDMDRLRQERMNVSEPLKIDERYGDGETNYVWIWKEPVLGNRYILSADVASGDGTDYSAFTIIEFETGEQVAEFQGKIPPDVFANIIYEYGIAYGAYVVIDNIGYGATTALKLKELNYPNLHYDETTPRALVSDDKLNAPIDTTNKIPGFNVSGVRLPMIANLEEKIRTNAVKIRSKRVLKEITTFIYKNGRPDHQSGKNDDCLMSMAIGLWIIESHFKRLETNKNTSKKLLSSWVSSGGNTTPVYESAEQAKRVNSYFNPFAVTSQNTENQRRDNLTQNSRDLWLFGF